MIRGINTQYPAMPISAPTKACPAASSAVRRITCPVVAPAKRRDASRASRRDAANRAAEPASATNGTISSRQAKNASTTYAVAY